MKNYTLTLLLLTLNLLNNTFGQSYYSIKTLSTNQYISCENGAKPITATRTAVGAWELFEKIESGDYFAFKSKQNNEYISDEDGGLMTCNQPDSSLGDWGKFTLISLDNDVYAIQGNNGMYMTHSEGDGTQLICNSNIIGTNQRFVIAIEDECSSKTWTPAPNWKDSYQANGFCWCDTTFDHDLDNIDLVWFEINGERRNIRTICEELEQHPNYRAFLDGDPIFNDIQCGNGPANTALDETCCPGRTDLTPSSSGCQVIGEGWDIAWLESRSIFGGTSTTTFPDPTKTYYMDAPYHNKRIGADGISEDPFTTSTTTTGEDVVWQFVANGDYWHLQRAAGGTNPRLRTDNSDFADMQSTQWSGRYTYYELTKGDISETYFLTLPDGPDAHKRLQLNANGTIKFVPITHEGTWESFKFTEVESTNNKSVINNKLALSLENNEALVFPNPLSGNELNINTQVSKDSHASVAIINYLGQTILEKDLGVLETGFVNITINDIKKHATTKGIYIVKLKVGETISMHKIMID